MPEPVKTAARWRDYCAKMGLGNPYLVAVQGYGFRDPREVGFDAALEFPPHNHRFHEINAALNIVNPSYQGRIHSYYEAIQNFGQSNTHPYEVFRGLFPNWDNEARKPGKGVSFAFSSPRAYQYWLERLCRQTIEQQPDPQKRILFINAWNEWAEGAYLEPDRRYGYAYLEATTNALNSLAGNQMGHRTSLFDRPLQKKHETAVFIHLYYPDLWMELQSYLANLKGDFDLFVSIPELVEMDTRQILDFHQDTYLYQCDNRGRDIAPFLGMLRNTEPCGYRIALKLHTKRSRHIDNGDEWRTDLYRKLLGSPELVSRIKGMIARGRSNPIGFIVADGHTLSSEPYLAANKANIERLSRMANIPYFGEEFHFFAGSMFWFSPASLLPLTLLSLQNVDFEPEMGQLDGTLAHAIERFVGLLAERMGIPVYETDGENLKKFASGERTIYRFAPKKK